MERSFTAEADPKIEKLIDAALKLADVHDETVDGEWGSGNGTTITDESWAVREAVEELRPAPNLRAANSPGSGTDA